jgi:hypothetical protein
MLRLLLDEHISPDVAEGLRRRHKNISVTSLAEWEGGRFMGLADNVLLREAAAQELTLVTYDRRTIPPLLKAWAEASHDHGGVVFVDEKTILTSDFGGLIDALLQLYRNAVRWDWTNRVCFLRR